MNPILDDLETLLIREIPKAIGGLETPEPVYALRVYYDSIDMPDISTRLLLVKACVRKEFVAKYGNQAEHYIWCIDEHDSSRMAYSFEFYNHPEVSKLCAKWQKKLAQAESKNLKLFRKTIQYVCKSLNQLDWAQFCKPTDDFVVFPADGSHTFYDDLGDMQASVPDYKMELLRSRGYFGANSNKRTITDSAKDDVELDGTIETVEVQTDDDGSKTILPEADLVQITNWVETGTNIEQLKAVFLENPDWLHFEQGHGDFFFNAISRNQLELAAELIALGANVNTKRYMPGFAPDSALSNAATTGLAEAVTFLLSHHAHIDPDEQIPIKVIEAPRLTEEQIIETIAALSAGGLDLSVIYEDESGSHTNAIECAREYEFDQLVEYLKGQGCEFIN